MKRKNIIFGVMVSCFTLFFLITFFEILGQKVLFKDKLYIVDNVDHRNTPDGEDINSDGIRSKFEADYFREDDLNILFLGDSFVYGLGLPLNKSFPKQFEKITQTIHPEKRVKVANFGWTSSSPLLSYRLLRDIGKKYNPDIVVYCFDMSDFHDDIKYAKLFERKGIYKLLDICPITLITMRKILSNMPWCNWVHEKIFGFPSKRFFVTEKPLVETKQWISYTRNSIENINIFCREQLDAEFVLMVLPRSYQYSDREAPNNWEKNLYANLGQYAYEPFKYFASIQNEINYPVYSLLPDFENTKVFPTCFNDDPHWNEDGSRVAADAIYKYLLESSYLN